MVLKAHIISKYKVKKFNSMQKYNISDLNDSFKSINSSTNKAFLYEPTRNSVDVSTSDSLCSGGFCDSDFGFNGTTDSGRNFSNSTMEENYNWAILILSPLIVFGVSGNTLVCMAISMEKRLQSVTNYFLLSLAITDLLVCVIVMPFSIIHEFVGYWLFGAIVCDLFVTADVLMCTSSILHLCTISLERYMAVRSPLRTRNKSKNIVILKIVLVWVIALAISSPITILGIIDERNVLNENQCTLRNDDFIIYGSILAFFIPLIIMIISYSLTLYLLIGQSKLNHSGQQEGQPMIRRSLSRKPIRPRTRVKFPTRRTRSCPLGEHKNAIYSPMSTGRTHLKSSVSFPVNTRNNRHSNVTKENGERDNNTQNNTENKLNRSSSEIWRQQSRTSSLRGLVKKHQLVIKAANILLMKKADLRKEDEVQTEQKASKVIGIVFMIFIVCWAPFFIVNIMTALCKECHFEPTLITAFVWLGYVSSTLNPIIYTMFNKTFKLTFKKLILCRYDTMQRRKRVRSWLLSNGAGTYHVAASSTNSLETPC